jgi:P-type Cu2+ transporter
MKAKKGRCAMASNNPARNAHLAAPSSTASDAIAPQTARPSIRSTTRATPTCTHCSLPVPAGLIDASATDQFCCEGCKTAFAVIHGCGLDRYYALREQANLASSPVHRTGRRYGEYDDATFHSLYATALPNGSKRIDLLLQGVHCSACVWLVERLPALVPGVQSATLDFRRATLTVTWDDNHAKLSRVAFVLESLGYAPHPARGVKARSLRTQEDRKALAGLAVAGAIGSNVMLIAVALYAGLFDAMEASHVQLFRWVSMALSVVSLLWPGLPFLRGAWAAIRTRTLHLDVPIAAGLSLGVIWGVVNTIRGTGDIYFRADFLLAGGPIHPAPPTTLRRRQR